MTVAQIIIGAILLVAAVFLVIAVLMQEGKSNRLSGAIAGGADTMFGKTKGKKISDTLSKVTTVVSIVFVIIVLSLSVLTSSDNVYLPDVDDTGTSADASKTEEPATESASAEENTPTVSTPAESQPTESVTPSAEA